MKQFWLVLAVQANMIYFAIMSILGREYHGSEESNSFILFCGLSSLVALIIVAIEEIRMKNKRCTFMFFIPLLIYLVDYLRVSGVFANVPNLNRNTLIFLCYSVPAIFVGTHLANTRSFFKAMKWFDYSMFLLSFGLLLSLPRLLSHQVVTMSGSTYQAFSYMAAFCFGINFYKVLEGDDYQIGRAFKVILVIVRVVFLAVQFICVFLGGGRGAALLLLVSPLILLRIKGISLLKTILYLTIAIALVVLILGRTGTSMSEQIRSGYERAFSYITDSGIDVEETSGRDQVYEEAFRSIQKRPVLGYGLLGYLVPENYSYGYSPHNFFLEILLQGGVIFLMIVIAFLVYIIRKLRRILSVDSRYSYIIPIALYPCVNLLFSGDYLLSSLFWFCLSFIVAFDKSQFVSK